MLALCSAVCTVPATAEPSLAKLKAAASVAYFSAALMTDCWRDICAFNSAMRALLASLTGSVASSSFAASIDASAAATLPRTTAELASLDVTARTAELPTLAERIAALLAELDGDRAGFPLRAFYDEQLTAMRDQLTVTAQRLGAAPQEMADAHAAAVAAMAPPEPAPAPEPADGLITGGQGDPAAPGDSTDPATAGGALGDGTTAPRGPAPPLHVGQDPNDPINDPAVIAGLTYEDYTGCRAYAGFTPDALDEHRRPYAKVDCRTKQPIG